MSLRDDAIGQELPETIEPITTQQFHFTAVSLIARIAAVYTAIEDCRPNCAGVLCYGRG